MSSGPGGIPHGDPEARAEIRADCYESLEFVPTVSAWHPIVAYTAQRTGDNLHGDFAWSQDRDLLGSATPIRGAISL